MIDFLTDWVILHPQVATHHGDESRFIQAAGVLGLAASGCTFASARKEKRHHV